MSLLFAVLEIVAPVFLLASVGFAWVRLGFEYRVQFVTQLAMSLSVPCLVFTSLMKTEIDLATLGGLSIAAVLVYGALTILLWGVVRLGRLDMRTYLAPLIFGNTGNVGLPLALFAFGRAGLDYAVVVFAVMAIWSFTFGIWVVSGGNALRKVLREPMVAATLLGALFLWQGWETPRFLTSTLDLAAQIAIPIMLITLGVAVARLRPGRITLAFILSLVKLVLCAGLAWSIGRYVALDPVPLAVLILQVSTPVAVTSYMIAEKYGADSDAVAGLVVMSTLTSIGAMPLLLGLLLEV